MKYQEFIKNYKYPLLITAVTAAALFIVFLNQKNGAEFVSKTSDAKLVSAVEFDKLSQNPNAFLLDVHTPEQKHIPGTDEFIPYNEINSSPDKLPKDKNTPILVYCRTGSMSKSASEDLINLGYTNVYDLAGGLNAYREANVKVEINPPVKNLGTVIYGDIATTNFTLTNFTPRRLAITKVSTSCNCTSAEVTKKSLEPYESSEVKVSFNPAVHKDDTDLGELTRTIYIETDNPNFKKVTAEITANVVKEK